MAALKATVALKGQSRSTFCAERVTGTASLCHRLIGHKGECRPTLNAATVPATKVAKRAGKRKVRRIPAAKVRRQVAAPQRRAKRTRRVQSGTPQLARPSVG